MEESGFESPEAEMCIQEKSTLATKPLNMLNSYELNRSDECDIYIQIIMLE